MPIYQLDEEMWFPSPYLGEEMGLVAIGGDLSVERLLLAYSNGFFPWFSFRDHEEPLWYCPLERFVIFPHEIHISHSMRTMLNSHRYECTFNADFDAVIKCCSEVGGRYGMDGAWLGPDIIRAYTALHRLGYAKSVEIWELPERRLVGGLYGVQIGKGFCGESMFSHVASASKLALIGLAQKCIREGWLFIDCQFETPHLRSMGGRTIPYDDYMMLLGE